jgi:hypothetical protein
MATMTTATQCTGADAIQAIAERNAGLLQVRGKQLYLDCPVQQCTPPPDPQTSQGTLFVVSTEAQDRDGDVVLSRGCRSAHYAANGAPWFFDHRERADFPLPIGTALDPATGLCSVQVLPDRVLAKCWFDSSDDGQQVGRLVHRGLLRGASISFDPLVHERLQADHTTTRRPRLLVSEWDLLEISVVGVGANPQALACELAKGYSAKICKAFDPYLPRTRSFSLPARPAPTKQLGPREPRPCPGCGQSNYVFFRGRDGAFVCAACSGASDDPATRPAAQDDAWGDVLTELIIAEVRLDGLAARLLPLGGVGGR